MAGSEEQTRLQGFREFYASLVAADPRVRKVFAEIPRENFLGPGPWRVRTPGGHVDVPAENPALLYQDVLVALTGDGGINNGQPSLHAMCLAALNIVEGETAVHVGAGTGYYTAMLAKLVGATGKVFAYEIETELAARARVNLAEFENVTVCERSGAQGPLPECDVLYVSAGASEPLAVWLDVLRPGGRLLFPLTPDHGFGGMLLVTRQADEQYAARFLCQAMFIPCVGGRNEAMGRQLTNAFRRGHWEEVKSLRRHTQPDKSCWAAGKDWCLSKAKLETEFPLLVERGRLPLSGLWESGRAHAGHARHAYFEGCGALPFARVCDCGVDSRAVARSAARRGRGALSGVAPLGAARLAPAPSGALQKITGAPNITR